MLLYYKARTYRRYKKRDNIREYYSRNRTLEFQEFYIF
jgi:hypothetical protein